MQYPVRAGDILDFIPDSLKHLPTPPSFKLRWPSRIDQRKAKTIAAMEDVAVHRPDAFRSEMIETLRSEMTPEDFEQSRERLIGYWDDADAYDKMVADLPEGEEIPPFEHPDIEALRELEFRVERASSRYRFMLEQNKSFTYAMLEIGFRVTCDGWSGIDAPCERKDGAVTLDAIEDMQVTLAEALDDAEMAATAYAQLITQCATMSRLGARRKNSSSPQPSSPDPKTSEPDTEAASKNGSSPESTEPSSAEAPAA